MGQITIKAYGKVIYDQTKPDKVCFAIAKDQERRDNEFKERIEKQTDFRKPEDIKAF